MADSPSAAPGFLKSDSDHFRLLVGGVREYAIYMLDPDGHVLTWNPGAERLKGYSEKEILGAHFSQFFTPEDRKSDVPQRILADAKQRGAHREEGWRVRKNGTQFWADIVITALYAPDGALRGFAKVTRDETEKHAIQEQLRESEERFRLLVGGLKEHALYMLDPTGRIVNWNMGAEFIKQYTAKEVIGRHFSIFFTPDERAGGKPKRELDLAAKIGVYEEEGWRVRKDGTRFWASVVVTAIRGEDGEIKGFAKVTRDETRRHQADIDIQQALERATEAERRLREHAADLEERVTERTRMLVEQKESLRRLNEELEHFAYVASHDLQEPLRMVSMHLDLLIRRSAERLDERSKALVTTALQGTERMHRLISSLLSYARIDHMPKSLELTDANRAYSEAMQNLRPMVERTQAIVEAKNLPGLPITHEQLVQVFQNLIGNAIKYNHSSPPKVEIGVSREEDAYAVHIRDNGIGIDGKLLAQVFRPFCRLHSQAEFDGNGIGLAIVKKIIERHGGKVSVESILGQGSCFSFSLRVG